MDRFLHYIEIKEFVRWVLHPDKQLDEFWTNYLENNPEEEETMKLARLLVMSLKSKRKNEIGNVPTDLFASIVSRIEDRKKRSALFQISFTVLKYAAVGVLFFMMGIAFYNNQKADGLKNLYQLLAETQSNSSQVHLLLSDGNDIRVSGKESAIEYLDIERFVINRQDTLTSGSAMHKSAVNQLIVPYGKNASIKLPDGTMAYLNAGSRLVYPSVFGDDRREVFLIGEGFFEVNHNKKKPFLVKSGDQEVEVLGTRFNVSAYPSDDFVETVLVEGKVKVRKNGIHLFENVYTLKPNQRAVYNKRQSEMRITSVDVQNYISWHEGYLNFETSDLNRIIKKLERYYDIQIILDDPSLGVKTISGKLKLINEPKSVLDVLAMTASLNLIKLKESTYALK
ncbi:FecR family protein [Sunxiuqinia sp. sy24]|uniref:FecR family protein n=1 Tax=Sunxiuqinia sp. sy24 TaxID=3461495 RepID=UPI0040461CEB